jgi:hypothetical protein
MKFESFAELSARVDAETRRIRSGEQYVGPWRVNPKTNCLEHARVHYEVDLDRVTTGRRALSAVVHAAEKEALLDHASVGALARMFDRLGLLPHGAF